MSRTRVSGAALLMSLTLIGGLTACGSDDEGSSSSSTSSSSAAESSDTATESATSSESSASESESEAADGDKPSKDEVVEGYSGIVKEMMSSLPDDAVDQATTCIVDEIYDDASVQTLQALADGDASKVDQADASLFTDAQTSCTESLSSQSS